MLLAGQVIGTTRSPFISQERQEPQTCKEKGFGLIGTDEQDSVMLQGLVAFTGKLGSMKRAEAFLLVEKHGGNAEFSWG
jgi:hypothetical protein